MSMMDFAGALGGAGGAGAPAAAAPPDAAPPDAGPADDSAGGSEQFSSSLDALNAAEDALHAFIQLDPDDGDRAIAAQCLQSVLKLKAANQQDASSGGMKSLKRALAGSAGAGGGGSGGY
jgi:hypothetical protein